MGRRREVTGAAHARPSTRAPTPRCRRPVARAHAGWARHVPAEARERQTRRAGPFRGQWAEPHRPGRRRGPAARRAGGGPRPARPVRARRGGARRVAGRALCGRTARLCSAATAHAPRRPATVRQPARPTLERSTGAAAPPGGQARRWAGVQVGGSAARDTLESPVFLSQPRPRAFEARPADVSAAARRHASARRRRELRAARARGAAPRGSTRRARAP